MKYAPGLARDIRSTRNLAHAHIRTHILYRIRSEAGASLQSEMIDNDQQTLYRLWSELCDDEMMMMMMMSITISARG